MWHAEARPSFGIYAFLKSLRNFTYAFISFTPELTAKLVKIFECCFLCWVAFYSVPDILKKILLSYWRIYIVSSTYQLDEEHVLPKGSKKKVQIHVKRIQVTDDS